MINNRNDNPIAQIASGLRPKDTAVRQEAIHGPVCQSFVRSLLVQTWLELVAFIIVGIQKEKNDFIYLNKLTLF